MGSYVEMPKANPGPLGSGLYKPAQEGPGVISRAFIYACMSVLDMYTVGFIINHFRVYVEL